MGAPAATMGGGSLGALTAEIRMALNPSDQQQIDSFVKYAPQFEKTYREFQRGGPAMFQGLAGLAALGSQGNVFQNTMNSFKQAFSGLTDVLDALYLKAALPDIKAATGKFVGMVKEMSDAAEDGSTTLRIIGDFKSAKNLIPEAWDTFKEAGKLYAATAPERMLRGAAKTEFDFDFTPLKILKQDIIDGAMDGGVKLKAALVDGANVIAERISNAINRDRSNPIVEGLGNVLRVGGESVLSIFGRQPAPPPSYGMIGSG